MTLKELNEAIANNTYKSDDSNPHGNLWIF